MTGAAQRLIDMRMREGAIAASIAVLTACLPAAADGIGNESARVWETCGLCHGLDGNSAMAKFPKLAGQVAPYIEKQLHDFRSGARNNDGGQMAAIVTEFTEEQIAEAARYFARLQRKARKGDSVSKPSARAELLFAKGDATANIAACAGCHAAPPGSLASGAIAGPRLRGQHEEYLAKQLRDFRSGERRNDATGVMQAVAAALSPADIDELAAYVSGLPPEPPSPTQ